MLITSIKLWSVELLSITWNVSRHEDRAALWDDKFPGGIGSRSKFDSLRWWKILICHRPPYAGPRLCLSNVSFFELNKSLPSERNFLPRLLLPFLSASCNKFNSIFFALPNWFSFVLLSTFFCCLFMFAFIVRQMSFVLTNAAVSVIPGAHKASTESLFVTIVWAAYLNDNCIHLPICRFKRHDSS